MNHLRYLLLNGVPVSVEFFDDDGKPVPADRAVTEGYFVSGEQQRIGMGVIAAMSKPPEAPQGN